MCTSCDTNLCLPVLLIAVFLPPDLPGGDGALVVVVLGDTIVLTPGIRPYARCQYTRTKRMSIDQVECPLTKLSVNCHFRFVQTAFPLAARTSAGLETATSHVANSQKRYAGV